MTIVLAARLVESQRTELKNLKSHLIFQVALYAPLLGFNRCTGLVFHHAIAQNADAFDFELDHVARFDEPQVLQAAAIADSSRAE